MMNRRVFLGSIAAMALVAHPGTGEGAKQNGGSGKLEVSKTVRWDWEMYGFSANATVKAIEPNRRILVEWGGAGQAPTTIDWIFQHRADGSTYVTITNHGFGGDLEQIAKQAIGATEGFAFLLAGAKAWLEHGIQLNLVQDKYPDGLPKADR